MLPHQRRKNEPFYREPIGDFGVASSVQDILSAGLVNSPEGWSWPRLVRGIGIAEGR